MAGRVRVRDAVVLTMFAAFLWGALFIPDSLAIVIVSTFIVSLLFFAYCTREFSK